MIESGIHIAGGVIVQYGVQEVKEQSDTVMIAITGLFDGVASMERWWKRSDMLYKVAEWLHENIITAAHTNVRIVNGCGVEARTVGEACMIKGIGFHFSFLRLFRYFEAA